MAQGIDDRSVVPEREAKSISHETTFEHDIDDQESLRAWLLDLTEACLLSLAPLQRRHAWIFHAGVTLILALAAIISGIITFEPHDKDLTVRVVGVVAILDGCFTLCVPILHRLGGKQITEKTPQVYSQIEQVCPRCGERGIYATGKIKCPECSLSFRVEII
ncbi:MAG: DinB/UmuC family translesion DNA polymerase [Pirellulaceae bacterium]